MVWEYSLALGDCPLEQTQEYERVVGSQVLDMVAAELPLVCRQISGHCEV